MKLDIQWSPSKLNRFVTTGILFHEVVCLKVKKEGIPNYFHPLSDSSISKLIASSSDHRHLKLLSGYETFHREGAPSDVGRSNCIPIEAVTNYETTNVAKPVQESGMSGSWRMFAFKYFGGIISLLCGSTFLVHSALTGNIFLLYIGGIPLLQIGAWLNYYSYYALLPTPKDDVYSDSGHLKLFLYTACGGLTLAACGYGADLYLVASKYPDLFLIVGCTFIHIYGTTLFFFNLFRFTWKF